MAKLIPLGEAVTRGEQRTLEYLQKKLPADWVIFGNAQVTTGELTREIDAIIIGNRCVWVVDEKGFTGTLTGDEHTWIFADGSARERVLNHILHAAKMLKGKLAAMDSRLAPVWVEGVVILSAPDVQLKVKDPRISAHVCKLADCERFFGQVSCQGKNLSPHERDLIQGLIAGEKVVARLKQRLQKIGHYRLLEKLAAGPVVQSYRAEREKFGEEALLKLYDFSSIPESDTREVWQKRAERECKTLSKLRHIPGVVRVVESFQEVSGYGGDLYYFALDLPSGPSLASRLAEAEWTAENRLAAAKRLCEIVQSFHEAKVIHRQLSPANMYFYQTEYDFVITGFELSRLPTSSLPPLDDLPQSPYRAPEVTESLQNASEASDVYSLGVILFEIFSGAKPFGNRPRQSQDPEPELHVLGDLADLVKLDDLQALIQLMVAYDPKERLKDLSEVLGLLDDLLEEKPTPSPRPQAGLHPLPQGAPLGDYIILGYLGAGGCFHAYRVARHEEDSQEYVAKVLRFPELLEQARWAFNALNVLDHPNIIRAFDVRTAPESSYHLLEKYAPGKSCRDIIAQGRTPGTLVAKWAVALADALAYMETRNPAVFHGDISPSNIIIDNNQPYLIDFGLAYLGGTGPQGGIVGTAPYRPPERDLPNVDWPPSGDVYSLGLILSELLFGELPYDCEGGVWNKPKIREDFFSSANLASRELLTTLRRAISPEATDRFSNAREFQQALMACPELGDKAPSLRQERGIVPYLTEAIKVYNRGACNAENRGLDSWFARATYVPTDLDHDLMPKILDRQFALVILAGNPGDGKTAFLQQLALRLGFQGEALPLNHWIMEHDGWTYECVLDGSAADSLRGLSSDEVLESLFDPLIQAGERADLAAHLKRTQILAINDGRLLEFLEERRQEPIWLFEHLNRFFDSELGRPHPEIVLVDLNRRSLLAGNNHRSTFDEILTALITGGWGDYIPTDDPWQVCQSCRAAPSCHVRFHVETLRDPVLGPQVRERLKTLLAIVHSRGRLHVTIRELRSMLAYIIFGDQPCEEIHRELEEAQSREEAGEGLFEEFMKRHKAKLYFDRVFTTGEKGGRLLAELVDFDPGKVDNPRMDRFIASSLKSPDRLEDLFTSAAGRLPHRSLRWSAERQSDRDSFWGFAEIRRRLFFEGRTKEDRAGGAYSWLEMTPFRSFPKWMENLAAFRQGRYELPDDLCRLICRGISLTDNVPEDLLDRYLAVRTAASPKTDLIVVRLFDLEQFRLAWERSETQALILSALPTAMLFQFGPQGDPTLEITAELFELLIRFAEGYRLGSAELEGVAANLELFKNRLLAMPAQEVCLLHPSLGSYRARQELQEGTRCIVLEAMS
ncbi:MAG: protein kinase domain-containing protein [Desulfobaccales bacterium]